MKIVKCLAMNTKLKSTAQLALFLLISVSSAFGTDGNEDLIDTKFQNLDRKINVELNKLKKDVEGLKNKNIDLNKENITLNQKICNIEEENKKLKIENVLKIKRSNEELIRLIKKGVENSFNPNIYLTLYPDVKIDSHRKKRPTNETDEQYAKWHFCEHTLLYEFNPEIYINLYPAIKKEAEGHNMDLNTYAIWHYITFKNSYKW